MTDLLDKLHIVVKYTCTYCGKTGEWTFTPPAFVSKFYVSTIGASCDDCAKRARQQTDPDIEY